jgi:hypothetical protein
MAKILLLAISLGGPTLERYWKVLIDKSNKHLDYIRAALEVLLNSHFGFDEIYAKWLPMHLDHLNRGSLDILRDLNPKEFEHVRYSTVVSVNKLKERKTFDLNIAAIVKYAGRPKRNILESAVLAS